MIGFAPSMFQRMTGRLSWRRRAAVLTVVAPALALPARAFAHGGKVAGGAWIPLASSGAGIAIAAAAIVIVVSAVPILIYVRMTARARAGQQAIEADMGDVAQYIEDTRRTEAGEPPDRGQA